MQTSSLIPMILCCGLPLILSHLSIYMFGRYGRRLRLQLPITVEPERAVRRAAIEGAMNRKPTDKKPDPMPYGGGN